MSVPPFAPPVPQPLHGPQWTRPRTSSEYRVTQTFAHVNERISRLPHAALDIGNGHLGGVISAPAAGTVIAEGWLREPWSQTASAAQRRAWRSPNPSGYGGIMAVIGHSGGEYISALAHMSRTVVNKGQNVAAGQQVGNLGATGAAAVMGGHVHWDLYHRENARVDGYLVISYAGYSWRKVDAWPLLAQNWTASPDTGTSQPQQPQPTPPAPAPVQDDMSWTQYAYVMATSRLTVNAGTIPYAGPGREFGEHSPGYNFPAGDTLLTSLVVSLPNNAGRWYCAGRPDQPDLSRRGLFWIPGSGVASIAPISADAAAQDAADAFRSRIDAIKGKVAALAADIADD